MPGGVIRYVPLHPPKDGASKTVPASEWTIDFEKLEKTINPKTKMIVRDSKQDENFPYLPHESNYRTGSQHAVRIIDSPILSIRRNYMILTGSTATIPLAKFSMKQNSGELAT